MMQSTAQISPTDEDGPLLADFVRHRRQESFARIVERHGGMVLSVCRSVLHNASDAEDAAQAVFLTLAQKASSLSGRANVAGWLHHVAWYVASRAAESATARHRHEQESARMKNDLTHDEPSDIPTDHLHAALHELPDRYRTPLLLHYLEGHTEAQTAAHLGCKPSAVSMRLSRGRHMLRQRLLRRGITVSATALAVGVYEKSTMAAPSSFVISTSKIATSLLAGNAATAATSATVAALAKGAIDMLWFTKLRAAAAIGLAITLIGGTGIYLSVARAGANTQVPAATAAAKSPLDPVASEPAEVNGLAVQIESLHSLYSKEQQVVFKVTFTNTSKETFRLPNTPAMFSDWILLAENTDTHQTYTGGFYAPDGGGKMTVSPSLPIPPGKSMEMFAPFNFRFCLVKGTLAYDDFQKPLDTLFNSVKNNNWIAIEKGDPDHGIFNAFPAGTYKLSMNIRFPNKPDMSKDASLLWQGKEITSKPLQFAIGNIPESLQGSIAGTVFDSDGNRAANALIAYHTAAEYIYNHPPVQGSGNAGAIAGRPTPPNPPGLHEGYMGGIPAGKTDDSGNFVITGLAPDTYIVTVELPTVQKTNTNLSINRLTASVQPVIVSPGIQTDIHAIKLKRGPLPNGPQPNGPGAPTPVAAPSTLPSVSSSASASLPAATSHTKGLTYAEAPANAEELILDRVKKTPGNVGAAAGDLATLKISPPLVLWSMNFAEIANGAGTEKAWRSITGPFRNRFHYFLQNGGKGVLTADLLESDDGTGRVTSVALNEEADALRRAMEKVSKLPEIKEGSFEVRYLSIGAIFGSAPTSVLWLKSNDGGKDYIYYSTFIPLKTPFEEDKLYTAEEFFKILQPHAKSKLDRESGSGGRRAG